MKELFVGKSMSLIKKQYPEYSDEKLAEIRYGLASIYITVSKTIIICLIAFFLGILKELIIFTICHSLLRMTSFGLHATKSWICLVSSALIFLGLTFLSTVITLPLFIKIIVGLIGILLILKNSPADTAKKPIINPKRRLVYKILSTITATIFVILSIFITNNFLANCFLFTLVIQCFFTSKTIYKIFGLSYDNYKSYRQ